MRRSLISAEKARQLRTHHENERDEAVQKQGDEVLSQLSEKIQKDPTHTDFSVIKVSQTSVGDLLEEKSVGGYCARMLNDKGYTLSIQQRPRSDGHYLYASF